MSNHQSKCRKKKRDRQTSTVNGYKTEGLPKFYIQVELPETNERRSFTAVPNFAPTDPLSTIPLSPEGSNGIYHVAFVPGIPGKELFLEQIDVDVLRQSGISLLTVPPDTQSVQVHLAHISDKQETAELFFGVGKDGRLADAQIRIQASNFLEAERIAFNLVHCG